MVGERLGGDMLLIGKGKILTRDMENPIIYDGGILVEGDTIQKIGNFDALRKEFPEAEVIDAKGRTILPAFINCHHHIYSAFARGLSLNGYNPKGFLEILEGMWWRMDRVLDVEDSRLSAAATYLSCIENGVATVFDHHASYGGVLDSLFAIGDEAKKFGVRSCLCYEISDRNGKEAMQSALEENLRFADYAKKDPKNLAGLVGLHASFTLSDESLSYICEKNINNYGYHIHVAEGILDEEACLKEHGMRVVHRLNKFGILNKHSVAGHCVHITDDERDVLKANDTMVVHNPESNMGNAIGAPDVMRLLKEGILLGLGTDGYTSDMIESLKFANLLIKHSKADATIGFMEACDMLFRNNPKMVERTFGIQTGILKEGAMADIIILDYDEITPLDEKNLDGHILFGMNGGNVATTITAGVVRMKDKIILGMDKEEVIAKIRERARDFGKRINGL